MEHERNESIPHGIIGAYADLMDGWLQTVISYSDARQTRAIDWCRVPLTCNSTDGVHMLKPLLLLS